MSQHLDRVAVSKSKEPEMDGTRSAFRGTSIWLATVWLLVKIVPWVAAGGPDAWRMP